MPSADDADIKNDDIESIMMKECYVSPTDWIGYLASGIAGLGLSAATVGEIAAISAGTGGLALLVFGIGAGVTTAVTAASWNR